MPDYRKGYVKYTTVITPSRGIRSRMSLRVVGHRQVRWQSLRHAGSPRYRIVVVKQSRAIRRTAVTYRALFPCRLIELSAQLANTFRDEADCKGDMDR